MGERRQELISAPAKFPDDWQPQQHDESVVGRACTRCFFSAETQLSLRFAVSSVTAATASLITWHCTVSFRPEFRTYLQSRK
jgi:hypothetical protein